LQDFFFTVAACGSLAASHLTDPKPAGAEICKSSELMLEFQITAVPFFQRLEIY
jgi:hypothetical protein